MAFRDGSALSHSSQRSRETSFGLMAVVPVGRDCFVSLSGLNGRRFLLLFRYIRLLLRAQEWATGISFENFSIQHFGSSSKPFHAVTLSQWRERRLDLERERVADLLGPPQEKDEEEKTAPAASSRTGTSTEWEKHPGRRSALRITNTRHNRRRRRDVVLAAASSSVLVVITIVVEVISSDVSRT